MEQQEARGEAEARDGAPAQLQSPIGVILPTYNRSETLLRCLQHLEQQTWKEFEVIVVDDGSTDDTALQLRHYADRTALRFRHVRQENSGPARARNLAISLLNSPVCLMLGDDIFASPRLVELHLALHRARPEAEVAGLGLTQWSATGQIVSPFMRWLDSSGQQFAYRDLLRGAAPSWKHFYTSNLSLKTEHLRRHVFHEGFRKAAMEDMELGYRMEQQGALTMVFLKEARAEHLHPTSVAQACRRMITVGAAAYTFGELWPEHRQLPARGTVKQRLRRMLMEKQWRRQCLQSVASWITHFWCPNPIVIRILMLHFDAGYREAARGCVQG